MQEQIENSKVIKNICWFFIIAGLYEVFFFVVVTKSFLAIFPGLLTILPAFTNKDLHTRKRNYIVGIIALVKYNPISVAIVAFIIADFMSDFNYHPAFGLLFILIGLSSIVLGIIYIVKTSKHNKWIDDLKAN